MWPHPVCCHPGPHLGLGCRPLYLVYLFLILVLKYPESIVEGETYSGTDGMLTVQLDDIPSTHRFLNVSGFCIY